MSRAGHGTAPRRPAGSRSPRASPRARLCLFRPFAPVWSGLLASCWRPLRLRSSTRPANPFARLSSRSSSPLPPFSPPRPCRAWLPRSLCSGGGRVGRASRCMTCTSRLKAPPPPPPHRRTRKGRPNLRSRRSSSPPLLLPLPLPPHPLRLQPVLGPARDSAYAACVCAWGSERGREARRASLRILAAPISAWPGLAWRDATSLLCIGVNLCAQSFPKIFCGVPFCHADVLFVCCLFGAVTASLVRARANVFLFNLNNSGLH